MKLLENRRQLEREQQEAYKVASIAAHELQGFRENLRLARDRAALARKALNFMRYEAPAVSLNEYGKVKELLEQNEALIAQYESLGEAAKTKGTAAADRAKDIAEGLVTVDQEINESAKVLQFPVKLRVSVQQESDDVDDGDDD